MNKQIQQLKKIVFDFYKGFGYLRASNFKNKKLIEKFIKKWRKNVK